VTVRDGLFSGPLPDNDRTSSLPANFEAIAAGAGFAFVSGMTNLTLNNVTIENFPSIKGTIYVEGKSRLESLDSDFVNNGALYGGGIYIQDSSIDIEGGRIAKNSASRGGGLLIHGESSASMNRVSFEQNQAIEGGGLYIEIGECQGNSNK